MSNPHAANYGRWHAQAMWLRRWGFSVKPEGSGRYRVNSPWPIHLAVDAIVDVPSGAVIDEGPCRIGAVNIKEVAKSARRAIAIGAPGLRDYFKLSPWAAPEFYRELNRGRESASRRGRARAQLRRHMERRVEDLGRRGGTYPVGYIPKATLHHREEGLECPIHPLTKRRVRKIKDLGHRRSVKFHSDTCDWFVVVGGEVPYWQIKDGRVVKWGAPVSLASPCPGCHRYWPLREMSHAPTIWEPRTRALREAKEFSHLLGQMACGNCREVAANVVAVLETKTILNQAKREISNVRRDQRLWRAS